MNLVIDPEGFYGPISSPFVLNSCGQQSLKKKTTENLTLP